MKQLSITDLAAQIITTDPNRKLETVRAYIKAEIRRGKLPAKKVGNQYIISAADANKWLATPKRGSRSK